MSVIRSECKSNFTIIDNRIFSSNLSYKSIGLLCLLLSKPSNWEVSVTHLANLTDCSRYPSGRDYIYAMLNELIDAGYIQRSNSRDSSGKMSGCDYIVYDTPRIDLPLTEKPLTDLPLTVNTTQVSTDIEIRTEKATRTDSQNISPLKFDYKTILKEVDKQVVCDFIAIRKAKKSPLTETAINGIKREAQKAGLSLQQALTICCERGWVGFKAEWVNERISFEDRKEKKKRDNDAALDAWANGETLGTDENFIEGEFGYA